MVDCTKCKHLGLQKVDECSIMYTCDLDKLKDVGNGIKAMPDKCESFEPKGLTGEEKEIMKKLHVCPNDGLKYDEGKNRMGLMCENFSRALWEVAKVSTFGANRYGANNWQHLENPKERYMDALCRHLFKHLQGEKVDDESGLLHLQHMCWNALALLEFELKENHDIQNVWENFLNKAKEEMSGVAELKREYERSRTESEDKDE